MGTINESPVLVLDADGNMSPINGYVCTYCRWRGTSDHGPFPYDCAYKMPDGSVVNVSIPVKVKTWQDVVDYSRLLPLPEDEIWRWLSLRHDPETRQTVHHEVRRDGERIERHLHKCFLTNLNTVYWQEESGSCYGGHKNGVKEIAYTSNCRSGKSWVVGLTEDGNVEIIREVRYGCSPFYGYTNKQAESEPPPVFEKWRGIVHILNRSDYLFALDKTGKVFTTASAETVSTGIFDNIMSTEGFQTNLKWESHFSGTPDSILEHLPGGLIVLKRGYLYKADRCGELQVMEKCVADYAQKKHYKATLFKSGELKVETTAAKLFAQRPKDKVIKFYSFESHLIWLCKNGTVGYAGPKNVKSCKGLDQYHGVRDIDCTAERTRLILKGGSEICLPESSDDFRFQTQKKGITICGILKKVNDVVIPSYINGLPVVGISDYCFAKSKIDSIVIPETVRTIGEHCFDGCEDLSDVTIHGKIKVLRRGMFRGTTCLENIFLPDTITEIGESCFEDSGITRFVAPKRLKRIQAKAFFSSHVESAELNDGLEEIGDEAFHESKISQINYPVTLKRIGASAFQGRYNYGDDPGLLAPCACLPDGLEELGDEAFFRCKPGGATTIKFPKCLKKIGRLAFPDERIKLMILPSSLESCHRVMSEHACPEIRFWGSPEKILEGMFARSGLTEFVVPDGVKTIETSAFYSCEKLVRIALSPSVTKIERHAFLDCYKLHEIVFTDTPVCVDSNWISDMLHPDQLLKGVSPARFAAAKLAATQKDSNGKFPATVIL